jgi:thiamine-phosphate pyrophosphorylase
MPIRKIVAWLKSKRPSAKAEVDPNGPLIIVITPEEEAPNEIRTVKKLFEAGLPRLHLRRHDWGESDLRDWIEEIPKKYRTRIVLHGHPELVAELGLAGVHLQSVNGARAPRGRGGKPRGPHLPEGVAITRSCHDYEELLAGPKDCAYSTLGPIFPSISKRGYAPRRTPEEFAAIVEYWNRENKGHPVVALGGITPENIGELRRMGFAGAAVVGAIWESAAPVEAFKALRDGWSR